MAFGITKTRLSPIAVDFGADQLKLLQLERGSEDKLVAAACHVLPEAARQHPADRRAALADALPNLLRQHPFRSKRAFISIPAFQTLVLHLELPGSDTADLESQANLHLQTELGLNPASMVVRHHHVGSVLRSGKTHQAVVTIAVDRSTVMSYLELAQACRLEVAGMHAEPHCVVRAFSTVYTRRADDASRIAAYIDIGAATTKITIAQGDTLRFARLIHAGGEQLTRQFSKDNKIDFMEARLARVAHAAGSAVSISAATSHLIPTGSPLAALAASAPPATAVADDRRTDYHDQPEPDHECYHTLADELGLALRYHDEAFPDTPVDSLVFCGGEANHTALCRSLAQRFELRAQLGDPFVRLQRGPDVKPCPGIDPFAPQPGWAVPFGLCVSEANL
ncbi:MAG: pilus assembly protein PilM [Planctomycetota bacterium]